MNGVKGKTEYENNPKLLLFSFSSLFASGFCFQCVGVICLVFATRNNGAKICRPAPATAGVLSYNSRPTPPHTASYSGALPLNTHVNLATPVIYRLQQISSFIHRSGLFF